MKYAFAVLTVLATCCAMPAQAHDDATLDARSAPHGGQVRMAGSYHLELVLDPAARGDRPAGVQVYVTDHAEQTAVTSGMKATLTLLGKGGKQMVELRPAADRSLRGQASYVAEPGLKAIVQLDTGKGIEQARFTPFQRPAHSHH